MTIPGSANPLLMRSAAPTEYQISRSVRFNSSDSAYLSKNFGSAGNRKTWTWAGWVKRSALGNARFSLFTAGSDGTEFFFEQAIGADVLKFYYYNNSASAYQGTCATVAVFRDPSAWYHIVLAVDTTQATATNRCKIYVNGVEQSTTFAQNFIQNADLDVNNTVAHSIGKRSNTASDYFNGYLADIHFIDGQALDPTSFTEVSATTGQLVPIEYTFGTNPNNGTTWNSTYSAAFLGNAMTDSALVGSYSGVNSSITITLSSSVQVTSSLKLNLYANVANFTTYTTISINGTDQTSNMTLVESTGTNSGIWEVTGFTGTLSSITLGAQNGANNGISRVIVDDYVLINGADDNSFHLPFSDNSTAAALGTDTSGNGNTWTVSPNISVAAGSGNDSLVDTPTNGSQTDTGVGGEVVGNYCTWNPLQTATTHTLSNGNLDVTSTSSGFGHTRGTIAIASGKWYWEVAINTGGSGDSVGIISTAQSAITDYPGFYPDGYIYFRNGYKVNNDSGSSYGASYTTGDVIGVALDLDTGTLVFYKNGSSQGTAFSSLTGTFAPSVGDGSSSAGIDMTVNFGQRPFAHPVSGYKALCTANLPAPVVAQPSTVMDVKLYTGNGSTQTISGLGFSPDLVWLKARSAAERNVLFDQVRGAGYRLLSDGTESEALETNTLSAFTSDGFSLGVSNGVNGSSTSMVAWAWDAGSSTVTNTQGSITSTVRVNATSGFSVITYTGSSSNSTIGHGLGAPVDFAIFKNRTDSGVNWKVYHRSIGNTKALTLNTTGAEETFNYWQNTTPTSTLFYLSGNVSNVCAASKNYVAYMFSAVAGYSSFGSYTGNGSTDGPFVYTGFRPRWFLLKPTTTADNWRLFDSARNTYNYVDLQLSPNGSGAEVDGDTDYAIDFLSNGVKIRATNSGINGSGTTFIYAAFAENPFQYARAR